MNPDDVYSGQIWFDVTDFDWQTTNISGEFEAVVELRAWPEFVSAIFF